MCDGSASGALRLCAVCSRRRRGPWTLHVSRRTDLARRRRHRAGRAAIRRGRRRRAGGERRVRPRVLGVGFEYSGPTLLSPRVLGVPSTVPLLSTPRPSPRRAERCGLRSWRAGAKSEGTRGTADRSGTRCTLGACCYAEAACTRRCATAASVGTPGYYLGSLGLSKVPVGTLEWNGPVPVILLGTCAGRRTTACRRGSTAKCGSSAGRCRAASAGGTSQVSCEYAGVLLTFDIPRRSEYY